MMVALTVVGAGIICELGLQSNLIRECPSQTVGEFAKPHS